MARIRSVKPELRTSLTAAEWSRDVRYFWVLLWGYLDDHGRGVDEPRLVKADCLPLDDDISAADVDKWLDLIATPRDTAPASVCRYEVSGRRYLHVPRWTDHQKPQHPTDSRIPPCNRGADCGRGSRTFHEDLMRTPETLSGGHSEDFPDGSGVAVAPEQGESSAGQAGNDPGTDETAGQGTFMSGSRESHESLSGNGVPDTPSPTSVGEGVVDGEVGGEGENISPAKTARPDVERLCAHLADRIAANGSKRPSVGAKWRDAARLMLDSDGRTEEKIRAAIDWCQNDEFWRRNVMSMPALREQYDRLRLQADAERKAAGATRRGHRPYQNPLDDSAYEEPIL